MMIKRWIAAVREASQRWSGRQRQVAERRERRQVRQAYEQLTEPYGKEAAERLLTAPAATIIMTAEVKREQEVKR